jgi:methionyl-tRNA formyltransferase
MKIVFCGSPSFAVPPLERLLATDHEIACVITQPDRPAGRGLGLKAPPVKLTAVEHSLEVHQPEKFNTRVFLDQIEAIAPDIIVVVAYGKIFRRRSLGIPRLGCVNLHASLLPKYRGIAPINWAVINGEEETGVTTMFMDEGVDTGDVIMARSTPIREDETAGHLTERLSQLGADLLAETCDLMAEGKADRMKQDAASATYAPKLSKEDGRVRWGRSARQVHNHIRGVTPWPGAITLLGERQVKILESAAAEAQAGSPGRIIGIDSKQGLLVSCGSGAVWLRRLQAQGRKPVTGADFARGYRVGPGDFFGHETEQDSQG